MVCPVWVGYNSETWYLPVVQTYMDFKVQFIICVIFLCLVILNHNLFCALDNKKLRENLIAIWFEDRLDQVVIYEGKN